MHREMCQTDTDRDCLRGGRGSCRVCPYREGGALHRTTEQNHKMLVDSWYHYVLVGRGSLGREGAIWEVPWEWDGGPLQPAVRARIERRYRALARRITVEQSRTIRRMRRRSSVNDMVDATGLSTDDVWLWMLGLSRQPSAPHYSRPLELAHAALSEQDGSDG